MTFSSLIKEVLDTTEGGRPIPEDLRMTLARIWASLERPASWTSRSDRTALATAHHITSASSGFERALALAYIEGDTQSRALLQFAFADLFNHHAMEEA